MKARGGVFHWESVHGTPHGTPGQAGQVARIPGLKSETPRHAGAGWGNLRFLPGGKSRQPSGPGTFKTVVVPGR
jgi:hypothetical protein